MEPIFILAAILIFGVLVAVHEFGHFIAAKLCGVQVNEFSIGMGPLIWHKETEETQYSWRLLPIGGYCAMEGEDEDSGNERSFVRQGFWKKLLILAAVCIGSCWFWHEFPDGLSGGFGTICGSCGLFYRPDHRLCPGVFHDRRRRLDGRRHFL